MLLRDTSYPLVSSGIVSFQGLIDVPLISNEDYASLRQQIEVISAMTHKLSLSFSE